MWGLNGAGGGGAGGRFGGPLMPGAQQFMFGDPALIQLLGGGGGGGGGGMGMGGMGMGGMFGGGFGPGMMHMHGAPPGVQNFNDLLHHLMMNDPKYVLCCVLCVVCCVLCVVSGDAHSIHCSVRIGVLAYCAVVTVHRQLQRKRSTKYRTSKSRTTISVRVKRLDLIPIS